MAWHSLQPSGDLIIPWRHRTVARAETEYVDSPMIRVYLEEFDPQRNKWVSWGIENWCRWNAEHTDAEGYINRLGLGYESCGPHAWVPFPGGWEAIVDVPALM
jgi:hypothetical protein